jgi:tetratricopeptide (TPR) repeat protein
LISPQQLLQHMEVPEERGVYILGCRERRITVYSQQVRALNLVHALCVEGWVQAGSRVAVVGAGAAGLTAAAGAALRGCQVTLLEEKSDLLPLWRNNRSRWLHPHIYDWPQPGSEDPKADLSVLPWTAGRAEEVADQILADWELLAGEHGVEVETGARDVLLQPATGAKRVLSWNGKRPRREEFDAIILALGFGLEQKVAEVPWASYWNNDDLDDLVNDRPGAPVRYLVSGAGDGGLVDLMRIRLKNFRHERVVKDLLSGPELEEAKAQLLQIEQDYSRGRIPESDLGNHYDRLPVPKALDDKLRGRLRPDTTATLNARSSYYLSAGACILNRFLLSRLMAVDRIPYKQGDAEVKKAADGYAVTFKDLGKTEKYDKVIIRRGPEAESPLHRFFREGLDKVHVRLRELATLDQTRKPIFQHTDFARKSKAVQTIVSPAPTSSSKVASVLPTRGDCFGREEFVRQLVEAVLEPEPRPAVVLGPPGIGKSTLTIEALYYPEVEERYGRRRYFVRLDGATTKDLLVAAMGTTLGIQQDTALWEAVKGFLGSAPTLLVLDNTETPWRADEAGTEELLAELRGLPELTLVCSVRGSASPWIPRAGVCIELPQLGKDAARDLFCTVSRVARNHPMLDRLLAELDGVPLAIELLARAAQGVPLEVTWKRWQEKRTGLLKSAGKSLAAALEVSISGPQMNDAARRLLSLLAWLPDGMAGDDLEGLFPDNGWEASQVLSRVGLAFFEQDRLRMLAPIRDYVSEVRPPGAEDLGRAREYYYKLARELGPRAGTAGGAEAIARLVKELSSIEKLIEQGLRGSDVSGGVDVAIALTRFMHFSGYSTPRMLMHAASAAHQQNDMQSEARCIKSLGDIALARSEHAQAREQYEQALPLYKQVGDLLGQANCIQSLGDIALERSEHAQAREQYEQALPLYKQVGDLLGQANCIKSLGDIALERSEHAQAREQYEQALPLYERIPEPYSIGMAHRRLAWLPSDEVIKRKHLSAALLPSGLDDGRLIRLFDGLVAHVGA